MIQFKRGSTATWKKLKTPLAAGQPGYDKDKHKIKVGDGEKLWDKLPYASVTEEEILDSEANAKLRIEDDPESLAIITYGDAGPDNKTVGKLYLQYYDDEAEVDCVVSAGVQSGWNYQKWKSGFARCTKTFEFKTSVQTQVGESALYQNTTTLKEVEYPFTFKSVPDEVATIKSPSGLVWLAASKMLNTTRHSAIYSIVSGDKLTDNATYKISITVEGFWR